LEDIRQYAIQFKKEIQSKLRNYEEQLDETIDIDDATAKKDGITQ
jgi:hypothetical protein